MTSSNTHQFNEQDFDRSLSESEDALPIFKNALKDAYTYLEQQFNQGEDVTRLVFQHTDFVDKLLCRAYTHFIKQNDMALVAVGGYGRAELHPKSDTDILLLLPSDNQTSISDEVESLLTFLWDIGMEVGHSVRTIDDCIIEAKQDITVITNLVESRLICGSQDLFNKLHEVISPEKIWSSKEFFAAKLKEQEERYEKYNGTAYNLEPNVKEGPGGLRDIHMINWVTRRHFSSTSPHELVNKNFLTESEYNTLMEEQAFLWKIRFGLHILTGRHEDRFLFDHQRNLAKQFGYEDKDGRLAVEQLMKKYYQTVMDLSRINEMLLQLFKEAILYSTEDEKPVTINNRFQLVKNYVEATNENVFNEEPSSILEIFLILAQNPQYKGIRANTIRLLRNSRELIDDSFRNNMKCRGLFMKFLRQPHGVTRELRRMNRYGILAEYLPAFKNIVGQMQHDLFHHYTVDEHTLFVIRNIRRFTVPECFHEFPLCSNIIQRLPKLEILYLAGLFHDIAKGRGGDHSKLGAEDAITFCRHHGIRQYDAKLVAWLVSNHLVMSVTAQRKDISDPEVITEFAEKVSNQSQLDHLYLLTVADMRATNPTLWNAWKDSLLTQLYMSTTRLFRKGISNAKNQHSQVEETKKNAQQILEHSSGLLFKNIKQLWSSFDQDYFLRHSADRVAWHTESILKNNNPDAPLVMIYPEDEIREDYLEIFVYTKDHENIFSIMTTVFDKLRLNIVDARIITTCDGYTLDTYIALEEPGQKINRDERMKEIIQVLNDALINPSTAPTPVNHHLPRQIKSFKKSCQVFFRPDPNYPRTIMEVFATDQPGLLARIGVALTSCGIRLKNAKIATFGERAEDILFITDRKNLPVDDEKSQNHLRETIIKSLNS